jgi:hypothetical protein
MNCNQAAISARETFVARSAESHRASERRASIEPRSGESLEGAQRQSPSSERSERVPRGAERRVPRGAERRVPLSERSERVRQASGASESPPPARLTTAARCPAAARTLPAVACAASASLCNTHSPGTTSRARSRCGPPLATRRGACSGPGSRFLRPSATGMSGTVRSPVTRRYWSWSPTRFSSACQARCSSGDTSVMAWPSAPDRPVRPTRCT